MQISCIKLDHTLYSISTEVGFNVSAAKILWPEILRFMKKILANVLALYVNRQPKLMFYLN